MSKYALKQPSSAKHSVKSPEKEVLITDEAAIDFIVEFFPGFQRPDWPEAASAEEPPAEEASAEEASAEAAPAEAAPAEEELSPFEMKKKEATALVKKWVERLEDVKGTWKVNPKKPVKPRISTVRMLIAKTRRRDLENQLEEMNDDFFEAQSASAEEERESLKKEIASFGDKWGVEKPLFLLGPEKLSPLDVMDKRHVRDAMMNKLRQLFPELEEINIRSERDRVLGPDRKWQNAKKVKNGVVTIFVEDKR